MLHKPTAGNCGPHFIVGDARASASALLHKVRHALQQPLVACAAEAGQRLLLTMLQNRSAGGVLYDTRRHLNELPSHESDET